MKSDEIALRVDLSLGKGRARLDLRPHQGICRHQRRLSVLIFTSSFRGDAEASNPE